MSINKILLNIKKFKCLKNIYILPLLHLLLALYWLSFLLHNFGQDSSVWIFFDISCTTWELLILHRLRNTYTWRNWGRACTLLTLNVETSGTLTDRTATVDFSFLLDVAASNERPLVLDTLAEGAVQTSVEHRSLWSTSCKSLKSFSVRVKF